MIVIVSGSGLLWQLITVTEYKKKITQILREEQKEQKHFAFKNSPSNKSASDRQFKGTHGL